METKIPYYEVVNKLLIGLIFVGSMILVFKESMFPFLLQFQEIKINIGLETIITLSFFAIIYEIGLIINRCGSGLEDILKVCKLLPFSNDYKRFNNRKKECPTTATLSREYALSRTSTILFLIISIATFIKHGLIGFIPLAITFLFYFSMRKHAQKILKLME